MYTHTKYEVLMTSSGISATTSGDKISWEPGYTPHYVRAVGVVYTTSGMTASALQCLFKHISLVSGSVASTLATINGKDGDAPGKVVYKDGLAVKVNPGQSVVFNVAAIPSGVCNVRPFLWVEPTWERPANITALRATT